MPVCVHCAYPAPHSYTIYKTRSNIRLAACDRCQGFVDPLIEHPALIILLDLILLKPRVFLHLLYNRGSAPYHAVPPSDSSAHPRKHHTEERRAGRVNAMNDHLWRLLLLAIIVETATRLLPSGSPLEAVDVTARSVVVQLFVVLAETATQHAVTLALSLLALRLKDWWPRPIVRDTTKKPDEKDGRRLDFVPQVIPLTLLYTSVVPSLLQLLLSIWYTPPPLIQERLQSGTLHPLLAGFLDHLPHAITQYIPPAVLQTIAESEEMLSFMWRTTDKIWAGTRLLGGMSAGFGLRVVLPTKPWETTGIVLAGWAAASHVGRLASETLTQFLDAT